jgi:anaerobic selenocysteine-containing dehydrogenase
MPDHPLGVLCRIGRASPQIVHDPDRLHFPLRRSGPKGTWEFDRISWDEAFDLLTGKLVSIKEESGPEAAAIYTGRGSFDMALCDLFQPAGVAVSSASSVLFPFGSPNTLGVGALCYVSFAMIAPHVTMGELYITMDTDIEQAELIVIWGANPATDSPPWRTSTSWRPAGAAPRSLRSIPAATARHGNRRPNGSRSVPAPTALWPWG